MRLRHFAANDAPEWVRKISGGEYLTGTERIEWSEREGRMVMYTVNESHARLVTAEEICVIAADPEAPETRTVKTLTVRARLRVRGWWTLGLSRVASDSLGRYASLVEQGRRIELAEMAKWRADGRAARLLGDPRRCDARKRERRTSTPTRRTRARARRGVRLRRRRASPGRLRGERRDGGRPRGGDGGGVRTIDRDWSGRILRLLRRGAVRGRGCDAVGRGRGRGRGRGETSREEDAPRVESPLHVPLEDVEEDDESADEGAEDEGAEDEGAEGEGAKEGGADAKSRRFSFGDGDAPPSPSSTRSRRLCARRTRRRDGPSRNDVGGGTERRRSARSARHREKTRPRDGRARRARASLRWRRALVRAAMTCAAVALAKERRDDWMPVALAAKRTLVGRRARGSVAEEGETTREVREGKTSVEGGVAIGRDEGGGGRRRVGGAKAPKTIGANDI